MKDKLIIVLLLLFTQVAVAQNTVRTQFINEVYEIVNLQKKSKTHSVLEYSIPQKSSMYLKHCVISTIIDNDVNLQIWKSKANDYWVILHKIGDLKSVHTISIKIDTRTSSFSVKKGFGHDSHHTVLSNSNDLRNLSELFVLDKDNCVKTILDLKHRFGK